MTRPPPSDPDAPSPTEPPLETGFEEVAPETGAPARPRRRDPEWVEATDTVTKPIGPGELEDLGPSEGGLLDGSHCGANATVPRRMSLTVVGSIAYDAESYPSLEGYEKRTIRLNYWFSYYDNENRLPEWYFKRDGKVGSMNLDLFTPVRPSASSSGK